MRAKSHTLSHRTRAILREETGEAIGVVEGLEAALLGTASVDTAPAT
jgi:hypothetical protein